MELLPANLRHLRKKIGLTQEEMALELDLKKSTYASYENDDGNTPPSKTLYLIAQKFGISMMSLFDIDYTLLGTQDTLRISDQETYFPVSVDLNGTELVDLVPATFQAQAGYLRDYSDPGYIQSLPKINWDMGTYESGTKRIFQISGDSMLPIPSQSYILGVRKSYDEIINGQTYVVVTNQDILYKRIKKDGKKILLLSDNTLYPPQSILADEILQYWKALKAIVDIPESPTINLDDMQNTIKDTNEKVQQVLDKLSSQKIKK